MSEEKYDDLLLSTAGFDIGNFDPNNIQTDEVICVTLAVDISPSIRGFEADLNTAFKEFVEEMQKSHVADKLMVKIIVFNEHVVDKTGFQPISMIDTSQIVFHGCGNGTALNEASFKAIAGVGRYRNDLEATGIQCKSLVFVITDGRDNEDRLNYGEQCKNLIGAMAADERTAMTFETIMFGVGEPSFFEAAKDQLGFKHLAIVGTTGADMRKLIGFVSASISRSSANQNIQF